MTIHQREFWSRLALVLCSWLIAGAACAGSLALSAEPSQDFDGHLAVLEDSRGTLDLAAIREADAEGHFQPGRNGHFSFGFTDGAVWLRFSVINPSDASIERWLTLDNSLLASAILHTVDRNGVVTTMVNGMVVPVAERSLATGRILFPLTVAAGEERTGYLRLSGAMPLASSVELWQPVAFAEAEWHRLTLKALVVVASLTAVVLFSLYFWKNNRRWAFLAIGFGDALFAVATFMVDGVAATSLPANEQLWQGRATGILVLVALYFHIEFGRVFLDLPRNAPRLAKALTALAAFSIVAATLQCVLLDQKLLTFQIPLAVTTLATVVVGLAAWRGIRNARLYLLNWAGLLVVIVLIMGGALAKLSVAAHVSTLPMPSFLLASLVLAYVMYREVRLAGEAAERSHQRLREFQRTEQERLAVAVEQRTRELRHAKAEAEEAGNARLGLLSTVSHELRTPLHTILGYAQLLRRKGGRREADAKLATIESSGLQLLHLIDEILEFIRGTNHSVALRPTVVASADLVRQMDDTGRVLAVSGRNLFSVELLGDLPPVVEVDEHRLLQVVDNLISNACKYTSNGRVVLRIERLAEVGDDPAMGVCHLSFTVEDTGIGIAADQHERIFEPFGRAAGNEYQPGIGLGLAIARQIVRAMGGDIGVESEPGRGSRFHFEISLPEVIQEPDRVAVDVPRIIGHVGPQRTLLVADDIAENRQFLHDLCSEWGFQVLVTEDGAEALAICRNTNPPPACVLVDQFMPGMDGWAFLRELRTGKDLRDLPVILVSAAEPRRPTGVPAEIDFDRVLLKPIRQQDLAESLGRLLGLEWILEQVVEEPKTVSGTAGKASAEQLAALRGMLELGRVVAIQRWAEDLAETRPDLAEFGAELAVSAEKVDLSGLEEILKRAEEHAPDSPT